MSKRKTPIATGMPKCFSDERYRLACAQPFLWLMKAREIRRAADLVWDQFQFEVTSYMDGTEETGQPFTGGVALMLYGFSVENLLKAGLVSKGMGVQPNGNFGLKSHALEDLANQLSINLDPSERELLERLEQFLEWGGRYPLPLYAEGLYPRAMLDGSKVPMCGFYGGQDRQRIDAIIEKIQLLLPTEDDALDAWARSASQP